MKRVLSQQLCRQFGHVLFYLLAMPRGSSGKRGGLVILASSCLGADSSHSWTLLGEVSSQSSIVDLLHVLLDFSFGVLQPVSLTLREKKREIRRELSEYRVARRNLGRRVEVEGGKVEREKKDEQLAGGPEHVPTVYPLRLFGF